MTAVGWKQQGNSLNSTTSNANGQGYFSPSLQKAARILVGAQMQY